MDVLRSHREWNQVELDVNRTLARFPPNINEEEREVLQQDLTPLIVRVLCDNPMYNYYQGTLDDLECNEAASILGFHDVCLTALLVLNVEKAYKALRILSKRGSFYNYLTSSLEESALTELQHIYVLLYLHDPDLESHLRSAELGTLFAISWPITWFSHSIQEYSQVIVYAEQ